MKVKKLILTVWLIIGLVTLVKAQQQKTDTIGTGQLSKEIGINKEKAIELRAAFNYNEDKIGKLIKDNTVPPVQKMRQIAVLLGERRVRIATLQLSDEQINKLKAQQAEGLQAARAWHEHIRQQSDASLREQAIQVTDGNGKAIGQ